MRYILIIASLFTLASCTLGGESVTPVTNPPQVEEEFIPSPTQPTGTGGLTLTGADIVSLSSVMDTTFTYLDSEQKSYASGTLRDIIGRYPHTVVYFYPKDGTPNCTIQALDFSLMLADFRAKGYNIIGVSKDKLDSHKAFAERNELKIQLLQDASGELLRAFGAEGPLQTYGNGDALSDIIRSTYVIDASGQAQYAIQNVEAKGHARAIYELVTGDKYTTTPTQTQTASTITLDTENTGSVSDKNIYKNENYGFQMVLPKDYVKYFEDKKTGTSFYYPAYMSLTESNESGGWEISSTGARQNEEWIHQVSLTGTTDNTRLYMTLPDNTSGAGGAPHVLISENQEKLYGYTLTKKLAWVTQMGTGTTDEGSWEIKYETGTRYIQIIQDGIYGSGYNNTISVNTEEIAKNILLQLVLK